MSNTPQLKQQKSSYVNTVQHHNTQSISHSQSKVQNRLTQPLQAQNSHIDLQNQKGIKSLRERKKALLLDNLTKTREDYEEVKSTQTMSIYNRFMINKQQVWRKMLSKQISLKLDER